MGWFDDLEKAIKTFREKHPENETFDSIVCNMYGDFEIHANKEVYIVTHEGFKIWHRKKDYSWERV